MRSGFNIFRKLENGEVLYISWRADLKQAERLVWDLNELWPAEYEIQEGSGEPYIIATVRRSN
jgi:hypothetical protein